MVGLPARRTVSVNRQPADRKLSSSQFGLMGKERANPVGLARLNFSVLPNKSESSRKPPQRLNRLRNKA